MLETMGCYMHVQVFILIDTAKWYSKKVKLIYIFLCLPKHYQQSFWFFYFDRLKMLSLSVLIYIVVEHLLRCVCLSNSWLNCLLTKSNSFGSFIFLLMISPCSLHSDTKPIFSSKLLIWDCIYSVPFTNL